MSGRSQGRPAANRRQTAYRNGAYVQGNTVRALNVQEAVKEAPKKQLSHAIRKNRDKAVHMSFGYVMFLSAALFFAGFVLIGYIQLQYEMTSSVKNISNLEKQLNNLKLDNDEQYNRILSSVDLEEIKRIAIDELGMQYAGQGQIVIISGEDSDYVRQYADIPNSK